jgi:hypothetical protein
MVHKTKNNYSKIYKVSLSESDHTKQKRIVLGKIETRKSVKNDNDLHKNFRGNVIRRSDCRISELSPILFPAFRPPFRVHRSGREVRQLDLRMRQVAVKIGSVRLFKSGAKSEI